MSAGVLLRYAGGGEVYALARPVVGLVWDLAVAGAVLRCRLDASTIPDGAWLRVAVDLATRASLPGVQRRVDVMLCGEGGREELPVVSRAVLRAEESARGLLG
jgi:hypothetical protein